MDVEDIAIGSIVKEGDSEEESEKDYIFIGDIGDNLVARETLVVYAIPEPEIRPRSQNDSGNLLE